MLSHVSTGARLGGRAPQERRGAGARSYHFVAPARRQKFEVLSSAQPLSSTTDALATASQRVTEWRKPWAPPAPPEQQQQWAAPLQPASLWVAYQRSLVRRPLLTKALTAAVCTVLGDSIAQALGGAPFSVPRLGRLAAYSATVGATTAHFWHRWLEANVQPHSPTASSTVAHKLALDQLLFTPVMTMCFLAALKLMEGQPAAMVPFVQARLLPTLLAGWTLWPGINVVIFKWVPQDLRILAGSLVGIAWGTFLSLSCVNTPPQTSLGPSCPAPPEA